MSRKLNFASLLATLFLFDLLNYMASSEKTQEKLNDVAFWGIAAGLVAVFVMYAFHNEHVPRSLAWVATLLASACLIASIKRFTEDGSLLSGVQIVVYFVFALWSIRNSSTQPEDKSNNTPEHW